MLCAVISVMASATEIPVGYSKGNISGSSAYIVNGKGVVCAATRVSPDLVAPYVGNEIRGIAVGIIDSRYCDSIRVFVASSLDDGYIASGLISRKDPDQSKRPANGWNNIPLNEAVTIAEGQEYFIGYEFYQRYKCEALSFVGNADENRTYVKRGTLGEWEDASSKGYLSAEMLIDGDNMPQTDLRIDAATGELIGAGTIKVSVTLRNQGQLTPADYDLTFSADGYNNVQTQNIPIAPGAQQVLDVTLENIPEGVGFDKPMTVSITRISSGEDAVPSDNSHGVGVKVSRNVVIEEFTGTGCGWCPRGLVGMEKLRNKFGNRFVGIAIHQYNSSDPMYPVRYKNIGLNSAPSSKINRVSELDPYYGSADDICDDFQAALDEGATASVDVTGAYNDDKTRVDASATITAHADLSGLKLGFVLIADSLTGTSAQWKQQNYYTSYSASQLPADLALFGSGGELGTSSFFWVFNDVAIGTYYENGQYEMSIGSLAQGESKTIEYSLDMPNKTILVNALKYDYVAVIAMLFDGEGHVINANKYYLGGNDPTGIINAATDNTNVREVARYTIDGRRISAPQRGMNIVKLSNGQSYKVMVK